MRHWLLKSEPSVCSVDDLAAQPGRRSRWDGVRNDARLVPGLRRPVTLAAMEAHRGLGDMKPLERGGRLPVMPVSRPQWDIILALERAP